MSASPTPSKNDKHAEEEIAKMRKQAEEQRAQAIKAEEDLLYKTQGITVISDRVQIPPSLALVKWIRSRYLADPKNPKKTVPYFCPDTQKQLLVCHEMNVRHQKQTVFMLALKIKKFGVNPDVRGRAIAIESPGGGPPYRLLSFGSLSRAFYLARQLWPTNQNIIDSEREHLEVEVFRFHAWSSHANN